MRKKIPEPIQTILENRANDPATLRAHRLNIQSTASESVRCAGISASLLSDLDDLTSDGSYQGRLKTAETALEVQTRIGVRPHEVIRDNEGAVAAILEGKHHPSYAEAVAFLENFSAEVARQKLAHQDLEETLAHLVTAYQSGLRR